MDYVKAIQKLEAEWEQVNMSGFFGKLRLGIYDEEGFKRVQSILNSVEVPAGDTIDKRFVEVTWFMPTYMREQLVAWDEIAEDASTAAALERAIDYIEQRLTTILGLP